MSFHWHFHVSVGISVRVAPRFETRQLEEIFRHKVFKMLLTKGKITEELIDMLMTWRHSGFNVFCGPRIQPGEQQSMENLARYIIRASFSQERMTYIPEEPKVIYQSKNSLFMEWGISEMWLSVNIRAISTYCISFQRPETQ